MHSTTENLPPTEPSPRPRSAGAGRDPLVDGLRSVALGRVVLWHAYALPWLSWIFPAMPVMFFLAGSVLAGSAAARPGAGLVANVRRFPRRAGRLLIPFWVYSLGVLAVTTAVTTSGPPTDSAGSWSGSWASMLVPLPETSGTDRDWLTGHLWYLTDYLVLLALLPVAILLARRIWWVLAVALLGLAALELAPLLDLPSLTGGARVAVGDLLCYGTFAVLGIAWARRAPASDGRSPSRRAMAGRVAGGAGLIAGTVLAATVVPLPTGSLNESYLLLTVAALGWLLLVAAAEHPLRRIAARPRIASASRSVSARALTVYLWHPAAIVLALSLAPDGPMGAPVVLAFTALFTIAAVGAFGWVEDLAARRPANWWPGRPIGPVRLPALPAVATVVGLVVTTSALTGVFGERSEQSVLAIPRPSDRTALADSAFADATAQAAAERDYALDRAADQLQVTLERWIDAQPDISDSVVGVASGDQIWTGSAPRDGEPRLADSTVSIASMTKTFTAALAVQLATEGLLDLDAPVPDVPGVAPFADGSTVTPRQLAQHSTGLIQYSEAADFDPSRTYSAEELVSLAVRAPRAHAADEGVTYSNANYLWLGLVLEFVSGKDYPTLLRERISEPLGLSTVDLPTSDRTGWVGSASGGIAASPADVARFFDALLDRGQVLPDDALARMTNLDHLNGGLGLWPLCPCGEAPEGGGKWATGLGHFIGDGAAFAFPGDRLAVYVRIGGPGDQPLTTERTVQLRDQLLVLMRAAATADPDQPFEPAIESPTAPVTESPTAPTEPTGDPTVGPTVLPTA